MNAAPEATPQAAPKSIGWAARIAKAPWRLIGIVLLVVVLLNIDLRQVADRFARIGPMALAMTAGAFILVLIGRYWRWRVLTLAVGARQPLWDTVASCNRAVWLGLVTPGRIGEFRRAADLSMVRGWGLAASSGLVLVDILIDLGAYAAIALSGLSYFSIPAPWGGIGALAILAMAALVLLSLGGIAGLVARYVPVLRGVPGFAEVLPALRDGLRGTQAIQVLASALLTTAGYVLTIWSAVHSMQPDLRLDEVAASAGLAGIAGAIPITYFGLGTRDVTLIWFFRGLGRPAEQAITLSFCYIVVQLIGIFLSLAAGPLIGLIQRSRRSGQSGS